MAHFARKLWYNAHDGEDSHVFAALLELRRRKNGKPVAFVFVEHRVFTSGHLGRPSGTCEDRMLRLPRCKSAEEAVELYSPGKKKFPGWDNKKWERTTGWAYAVGAGGSYEFHHPGTWVRTATPNPWRNRRRRSRGISCDASYQLRINQEELRHTIEELSNAQYELMQGPDCIDEVDVDSTPGQFMWMAELAARVQKLGVKLAAIKTRVVTLTDELRFKKAKALGVPYWPRREDGTIDQKRLALA